MNYFQVLTNNLSICLDSDVAYYHYFNKGDIIKLYFDNDGLKLKFDNFIIDYNINKDYNTHQFLFPHKFFYKLLNKEWSTDSFVEQAKSLFYIISRYGKYKHYSPCESDIKSLSLCK